MLTHKGTQTIETNRLILRRFVAEDAGAMFRNWANDSEVCRFMTWQPHGEIENTRILLDKWIAEYINDYCYHWAIISKDIMEPIGSVGVNHIDSKAMWCEMGYCISRTYWNTGVMTEAVKAVLDYLFREIGFNRIQAKHHADNPASGRVMQKSGMTYEGTLRKASYTDALGLYDCKLYSILRDEYGLEV